MQTVGTPVSQVREHKKITDEIDDMYMDTVYNVSAIQTHLVRRGGRNRTEQFLLFHRSFFGLFAHTRYMKGMDVENILDEKKSDAEPKKDEEEEENNPLLDRIDYWFRWCRKGIPANRRGDRLIEMGIDLFAEYQKRLINVGVITIAR